MPKEEKEKQERKQVFLAYSLARSPEERGSQWFCRAVNWEGLNREALEEEANR